LLAEYRLAGDEASMPFGDAHKAALVELLGRAGCDPLLTVVDRPCWSKSAGWRLQAWGWIAAPGQ
jgi:hypothetical protein